MALDATAAEALLNERFSLIANPPPDPVVAEEPTPHGYRYLRPLVEAADDLVAQARTLTSGERIYTGIDVFDQAMRGLAPKELLVVQGFAHSGKTLFVTEMIRSNADRRIVLFTADEDRVLVLSKLVSLVHGVSAEELERRIATGDEATVAMVRATAAEHFPNLVVFDDVSDINRMSKALAECRDYWGSKEHVVIFDYLDLLQGVGDGDGATKAKFNAIKAWGKEQACALVLMHQASRTGGADGAEMTLTSGAYGGEQQATFVIGVRRKKNYYQGILRELHEKKSKQTRVSEGIDDKITEAEYELARHQHTVTFNLVKNKRPPSRLVDDTDFALDADTGRIRPVDMAFSRTSSMGSQTARPHATVTPRESYGSVTVERPELEFTPDNADF